MSTLRLYSEPFARTGNIAAEGFRRLLGRPALGLLQTFIREGIQNVLDAAHEDVAPTVLIRVRTLSDSQRQALRVSILSELPLGDETRAEMEVALSKPILRVLELCDFGTEGLSGPTGADAPDDGREPLNFVNFLRNVGAARDTHHGGGTYGYGKSSLYAMSSCSTIVVDSQIANPHRCERRLMACHLGMAFDADIEDGSKRRFTGRHWWGVLDDSGSIEPATSELAERLSFDLGLPTRDSSQTGTSILVVDPIFGNDDLQSAADEIVETVLWNFWPRMTDTTPGNRKIGVVVELEDRQVAVPAPEEFPPLDLFAAAMAVQRAGGQEVRRIESQRPPRILGGLAIQRGLCAPRRGVAVRDGTVIPAQASHIALMRPIEFVVKYVVGDAYVDRRFEWAGVFVCSTDDEVEAAFASTEPPAHDDWIPDNLPKGRQKTMVRVAIREIEEIARSHANPTSSVEGRGERGPSLAATAAKMGALLDRVSATGPGRARPASSSPTSRKPLSILNLRFVGLEIDRTGTTMARFQAELNNDGSDPSLHVVAEPHLVVDGGSAGIDDLPGGLLPKVADIILDDIRQSPDGPWIHAGHRSGTVEVLVPTLSGVAVGLKLRLHSGSPA